MIRRPPRSTLFPYNDALPIPEDGAERAVPAQLLDLVRAGRKQHRGAGRLYRAAQDHVGHRLSALGWLLPGRAADAPRAARAAVPPGAAPGARLQRPRLPLPGLTAATPPHS